MKDFILYFKTQFAYWLVLFLVFVLPLILFFQFSTYPLPKVQYVFLGALFVSQYVFHREKDWMKSQEGKVIAQLKIELNKVPSTQEIINRQMMLSSFRNIVIAETALEILLVMFWYKQF